jgi:hypothetical protein
LRSRRSSTLVLGTLAAVCAACGSWDEVARVPAPGGGVDAVLVERNGGATTAFGYGVLLVPHRRGVHRYVSGTVASLYAAGRNEHAWGANLRWVAPDTLAVEYQSARDVALTNSAPLVAGTRVHVVLRPGVRDSAAPAGGMRWNRQGRPQ